MKRIILPNGRSCWTKSLKHWFDLLLKNRSNPMLLSLVTRSRFAWSEFVDCVCIYTDECVCKYLKKVITLFELLINLKNPTYRFTDRFKVDFAKCSTKNILTHLTDFFACFFSKLFQRMLTKTKIKGKQMDLAKKEETKEEEEKKQEHRFPSWTWIFMYFIAIRWIFICTSDQQRILNYNAWLRW